MPTDVPSCLDIAESFPNSARLPSRLAGDSPIQPDGEDLPPETDTYVWRYFTAAGWLSASHSHSNNVGADNGSAGLVAERCPKALRRGPPAETSAVASAADDACNAGIHGTKSGVVCATVSRAPCGRLAG